MNRFSYLAAISSVLAADFQSSQTLIEQGLEDTPNIQTFRTTDVTAAVASGGWFQMAGTYAAAEHVDTAKCMDVELKLVANEYFLVEVNQLVDEIVVVASGNDGAHGTPKFTLTDVANAADINANDKVAGTLVGANVATASDFILNYRYPAYRVKATGDNTAADGTTGYFGLVAKKGSNYHCKTWKTTVTTTARTTSLAQTTQALLKNDASNRLSPSTVQDIACGAKCTDTDPAAEGKWLDTVNNLGKKLTSEYFIAGVPLAGITSGGTQRAAAITTAATCKTGSTSSQSALATLNALENPGHVDTSTTAINTGTGVYNARTYKIPNAATAGQKYYSCIELSTPSAANAANVAKSYTAIEVEVTRPAFWQYNVEDTKASTRMLANQGTALAGLPKINEWGFTATALTGATAITTTTELGSTSNAVQMTTDISAIANTVWESGSAEKIDTQAVNARAGEYLFFKGTATAGIAIVNYWTGQAGMGRFTLPAESATFKHLELWSFAQPGNKYTATNAQPAVVLRVPTAAVKGSAKYYAGFQFAENAADTAVKFYTTSLQVTVTARRFGNVTDWKKSLVQPNFTAASNIKSLAVPAAPRTSAGGNTAWLTADQGSLNSYWTNGAVTGAIPGQVVGFQLPDKCRIEAVLTTSGTDFIANTATPVLEERGSFQGSVTAGSPGAISFMVPVDAADGDAAKQKYYGMLKIKSDTADQWLAVSVALATGAKSTGTNAILSDGLSTIHTGTAGGATVTVSEATVKTGVVAGAPAEWWKDTNYILTPNLALTDSAKAVIAIDANVGLTDTTDTKITTATERLTALRSAHIPAEGFKTNSPAANTATEWGTWPVVEVQMANTQVIDFDYTNKYLYRTYSMVLGGNGNGVAGVTYFGAIRAKVLSPEVWDTVANFDTNIPLSAKTYNGAAYSVFKVDTATTATAWTIGAAAGATATAPAAASGQPAAEWAPNAAASTNNQIKRDVNNGDSFVIAIDHNLGVVTWDTAAYPASKALERREELDCATFAAVGSATPCTPRWSFRMPTTAAAGEKYYAAFKAVVAASEPNSLTAGTYFVSIEGTVTAPIRHYATWGALSADTTLRSSVMWSFKNVGTDQSKVDDANTLAGASSSTKMDSTVAAAEWQGFNKQWWFSKTAATDVAAGWQESATNVFAANVAAGAEACFDFSEFTSPSLVAATQADGTALTAITGLQPAIAAQVTSAQLHNTDVGVKAWCFTAPASGFGYVIVKTVDWYLPIKISTSARERAFPTLATFTADAGDRWSGSVHRVYGDLAKQWADTPTGTTPKINTNFLIDEVAVKKASDGTDAAAAVDVGAFSVIIENVAGNQFSECTEYAEASMEDTADTPKALDRPDTWLTSFGSIHSATDFSRVGTDKWAFSWQVPSTAAAADVYYIGLRCKATAPATGDYSAMWKVSITDAPTFSAKSAELKVAPGNQKKTFTKFEDATEGKWVGAGAAGVGSTAEPGIPDPRWDTITASFEVEAGNGFSVEVKKDDATASVVAEADLNDEYGKPLNLEARSLILFGEVATLTASSGTAPNVVAAKWSALPAATTDTFPAYSWQVPSNAAVGEVHYAALRAVDGTNKYVALFECVVKATPAPAPEVVEEESGVMGAVITTALVTAAIAAALFFFVL